MPICNGQASTSNFTILFCATNVSIAGPLLHQIHMTGTQTVGMFLGGQSLPSCEQFPASTATAITTPAVFTGVAGRTGVGAGVVLGLAYVAVKSLLKFEITQNSAVSQVVLYRKTQRMPLLMASSFR
jgi:hypothetical protein